MVCWAIHWWHDEQGTVPVTAWVFVASILVLGLALSLTSMRLTLAKLDEAWQIGGP